MIKKLFFTWIIVFCGTLIFANPVTKDYARTIATKAYKIYASGNVKDFSIKDESATVYQGLTTFYTFAFNAGGFVMIAADDAVTPVLGYSVEGTFDFNSIPSNAQYFFNEYSQEIQSIVNSQLSNTQTIKEWNEIANGSYQKDIMAVTPMLVTTWDQMSPYNQLCPSGFPTGCVATAMAQIMKKWNYPTTGNGSHTYVDGTNGSLTANFGATTYAWASMTNGAPTTTAGKTAVATLMFHCGVSVDMAYASAGSGAYVSACPGSFKNYFKYQPTVEVKYKSSFPADNIAWIAMIKTEMDAGRPVLLGGDDNVSAGHAFVCDGYNTLATPKYHINWGWSGTSNGYFFLNALNPSGSNFSSNNQAVIRLTPLDPLKPIAEFTVDNNIPAIGAPVAFTDHSTGSPTTWSWTFSGGTPATSTSQNPTGITFATNGYHIITLTVTNAAGQDTKTSEHYVKVGGIPTKWAKQNSAFNAASRGIDQIAIVDPNVVWARAYDGVNPTGYIREFTRTNNGGTTWIPGAITFTNSANFGVSNIFPMSYTTAYACMFPTSSTGGAIVKTTDGGATWAIQTSAPFTGSWADFVHFFDANNGVCIGDPIATTASDFVIYTTSNGGTTWTQVPIASLPNSIANEAGIVNLYDAVGNTIWFATNKGRMYKSTDKGLTWTVTTTGFTNSFTMTFKDATTGIAVLDTVPYTIKKTVNGGTTWTTITPTGFLVNRPQLAFVPGTVATWVDVSVYPNNGSSYSIDDCATWINRDTGSVQFTDVAMYDMNTGWAGSFNTNSSDGGIYKWVPPYPVLTTTGASAITTTAANSGGNISEDGGTAVTARGVCWATTANPVVSGSHTTDGTGIGLFTSSLTGLTGATTYHVRAYATNSIGTAYGLDTTFTTLSGQTGYIVTGSVTYNNLTNTPMDLITVNLMNGTTTVATGSTDAYGKYTFNNVANGSYTFTASTTKPWGGVTATDALKMKRHIAALELFVEPIRSSGADVNLSSTITSTDVLKVQRRLAGLDASFTRPDWIFEMPSVGGNALTVNGADVSQNFLALCAADVNGSNTPVLMAKLSSVSLETSSVLSVNSNEIVNLPVRVSNSMEIGAMQLFMNYPSDKMEVVGVTMPDQNSELTFSAKNGDLRIVWTSIQPFFLNENDVIVTLQLKAIDNTVNGNVSLALQNGCELANGVGNVHSASVLNTSSVAFKSLSVGTIDLASSVNVYPNPSKNNVYIDLGKYSAKDVTITIFNTIGKQIAVVSKPEINNTFKYNFSGLADGIYFFQINTPDGNIIKKVSVNR